VFLSYARVDGEPFAAALRARIRSDAPEITLWQDREQLEGGVGWWTQIETALDRVKFLVIVITPGAIASPVTRQEWRYARQRGVIVYPVKGAPDEQLDYGRLPSWMRKTHLFDVGRLAGSEWRQGPEWDTFVRHLESDRQPIRVPFMAPDLPRHFVPRQREMDELLRNLIEARGASSHPVTTALRGPGGYGKTTMAAAICHDERVTETFDDGVLWASLGQTPNVVNELTRWYEALTGERHAFIDATQAAAQLAEKLEHRNCLLVVDDVWESAHLKPFLQGGPSCARLVTTRRLDLVSDAIRVRVDEMTMAESTRLLQSAFVQPIGDGALEALARRLGKWPLLLTLVNGMIRRRLVRGDSERGALQYVERALDKRGVTAFDNANAVQREEAVSRTVDASLDQLSDEDRARFLDLAIFPEETAVPLTVLGRLWRLDDLDTVDCAQRLDDVALLSLDLGVGAITLHDVMRRYLLQQRDDHASVHARLAANYGDAPETNDDADIYVWGWLPYHLWHAGQTEQLRALFLRPQWLHAQMEALGAPAVIADLEWMRGDRDIDVVQATLRLALPALSQDPAQLFEQLLSRLPWNFSERLDLFRRDLSRAAPEPRLRVVWRTLQGPGAALVQTLLVDSYVAGALLLPGGTPVSWHGDGTLRLWSLSTSESVVVANSQGTVTGARLLSDGRLISWGPAGALRVWDLSRPESHKLVGHQHSVIGAMQLPDGRVLSWDEGAEVRLWDLSTGDSRTLRGHTAPMVFFGALRNTPAGEVIAFPDNRALSWSTDITLRVWDLASGASQVLEGHGDWIGGALPFGEDHVLSWSNDGTVRVWALDTGSNRIVTQYESTVEGVLRLFDGRFLSWSFADEMRICDAATGEVTDITEARAHSRDWPRMRGTAIDGTRRFLGAMLQSDGRVLSWSGPGKLELWDLSAGDCQTLMGHHDRVLGAMELDDRRILSWGCDRSLRVWDIREDDNRVLIGHESDVRGALPLAPDTLLSWGADSTVRVWDLTARREPSVETHQARVTGLLAIDQKSVLSWSDGDATLRIWDRTSGDNRVLSGHTRSVKGVTLRPDGQALSWSDDGTLRVWDLATGESRPLLGHGRGVIGAVNVTGNRLVSWGHDDTLRVWDLTTDTATVYPVGLLGFGNGLMLPDGRLLCWGGAFPLRTFDVASGDFVEWRMDGETVRVNGASLLPDGRLAWWGNGRLCLWDLDTGLGRWLEGSDTIHVDGIVAVDEHLVSWRFLERELWHWNLTTGERRRLSGHERSVSGIRPLANGSVLSWSMDGTLRIWDLADNQHRVLNGRHAGWVQSTMLLPERRVVSWGDDRSVRVHHLDDDRPALACYLDAAPAAVAPVAPGELMVGDAIGRVHLLQLSSMPR
jgi:WD40 repeat protein